MKYGSPYAVVGNEYPDAFAIYRNAEEDEKYCGEYMCIALDCRIADICENEDIRALVHKYSDR